MLLCFYSFHYDSNFVRQSGRRKENRLLDRMKQAVTRTRENLAERIEEVVSIGKEIDRNTLDDLEATLIGADLGSTTTQEVLGKLRTRPTASRSKTYTNSSAC